VFLHFPAFLVSLDNFIQIRTPVQPDQTSDTPPSLWWVYDRRMESQLPFRRIGERRSKEARKAGKDKDALFSAKCPGRVKRARVL
jgi:hypothetical protein